MSYIYNLTDTWNAAGTTFAGIKMAVTNTASGASSKLLEVSVSGATTGSFSVDKNGNGSLSGALTLGTALSAANGGTGLTALGTGVSTALAVNVGTAGSFVANGGALGTPASGNFSTGTFTWPTFNQNTTGTAAGLSATLSVGSGGTGLTSITAGRIPYGNGNSPLNTTADLFFNGNFGIGTGGAPDALLHGKGNGDVGFRITKTSQSDYMMQALDSGVLRWYSFTDSVEIFRFVTRNFLLGTSNNPTGSAKILAMGTATAPTADVSAGDVAIWFDGTNLKARVGATVRTIDWT